MKIRTTAVLAATVIVMILMTGCAATGESRNSTSEPPETSSPVSNAEVPNVVGLSLPDATARLESAGFVATFPANSADDQIVESQAISAGRMAPVGASVFLTLSESAAQKAAREEVERAAAEAEAAEKAAADAAAAQVEAAYQAAVPTLDHWVGSLMGYETWRTTFCTLTPDFLRQYGEQYSKMLEGVTADHFVRYTTEKCAQG